MSASPGTTPQAASGSIHRPTQRTTKAGDWFTARQAGKRLPEHLFDEELEAALATRQLEAMP